MCSVTNENFHKRNSLDLSRTPLLDSTANETRQIKSLEKNIEFIRAQYDLTVKSLQDEIERLRKTNKDLQLQLVMCTCAQNAVINKDMESRSRMMLIYHNAILEQHVASNGKSERSPCHHQYSTEKQEDISLIQSQKSMTVRNPKLSNGPETVGENHGEIKENMQISLDHHAGRYGHKKERVVRIEMDTLPKEKHSIGRARTPKDCPPHFHRVACGVGRRMITPELHPDLFQAIPLTPRSTLDTTGSISMKSPNTKLHNKTVAGHFFNPPLSADYTRYTTPFKLPLLSTCDSSNHVTTDGLSKDTLVSSRSLPSPRRYNNQLSAETMKNRFTRGVTEHHDGTIHTIKRNFSHGQSFTRPPVPFLPVLKREDENRHSSRKRNLSGRPAP